MQGLVFIAATRIWKLAAVNLAALGLILLGLGLFGVAPAVVAALWATARLDERMAGGLTAGMWAEYRREFVRANLITLPVALAAALCLLIGLRGGGLALALLAPLGALAAAFALALLVVLSRLEATARESWANARIAFALAPWRHIGALALAPLALWVAWKQPPLGLYFGLSAPCLIVNLVLLPALACAMPNNREILS